MKFKIFMNRYKKLLNNEITQDLELVNLKLEQLQENPTRDKMISEIESLEYKLKKDNELDLINSEITNKFNKLDAKLKENDAKLKENETKINQNETTIDDLRLKFVTDIDNTIDKLMASYHQTVIGTIS